MKNERLMSLAAVFGWFGAYLFISIVATVLPEGVDCVVDFTGYEIISMEKDGNHWIAVVK